MNRGILILNRELSYLEKHGRNLSVEKYKPERVEHRVRACCKKHPRCRYAEECRRLFSLWSDKAPIKYSPAEFERMLQGIPTLEWMPVLVLGIRSTSWELPQRQVIDEIPITRREICA